ncbi:MAG: hypothetical protein ACYTF7_03275 [Planctomycetota bacterium]|jgi:hypothetical protein
MVRRYYLGIVVGFGLAFACEGQLTPPAGPVADSFKSLDEVEPRIPLSQETTPGDATREFIITEPGSYYLTQDTMLSASFMLISATGDVTIDLNGYTVEEPSGGWSLIFCNPSVEHLTIRNGTLRRGFLGVWTQARYTTFEDVHIVFTAGKGITANGLIDMRDCSIRFTGDTALNIETVASEHSVIRDTIIHSTGLDGISVTDHARIENVSISGVPRFALNAGGGAKIAGLNVESFGTSAQALSGVLIGPDSHLSDSVFHGYTGTAFAISLGQRCVASRILMTQAIDGSGIGLGASATLLDSGVHDSGATAVQAGSWCTLKRNTIQANTGLALLAVDNNTIEGNMFFGGDVSFANDNVVVRNTANAGLFVATGVGNSVGPINDLTSPTSNYVK